jgi:hypothetical protein
MFTFRCPEVGLEFLPLGVQRSVYAFGIQRFVIVRSRIEKS